MPKPPAPPLDELLTAARARLDAAADAYQAARKADNSKKTAETKRRREAALREMILATDRVAEIARKASSV
jgi:hypothetical protein